MIFLDNASTTELSKIVKKEIEKSLDFYFNPSAVYKIGFEIKKKIIEAKKDICKALGCQYNDNLVITGSATEANNLAIFGSIKKTQEQLIFSLGEHPSVYNCAVELKARGYNVKFISLNKDGEIDFENLKELLKEKTAFVSVMHVSNETGAINDIAKITKMVKQKYPKAIVHCDGVQAFGKISVNVTNLGVDFYTISAHKIHGPKGIGALYVKDIKVLKPIIFGGGQESGLRSGTENIPYVLSFGEIAKELNSEKIKENYEKVSKLNKYVRELFDYEKSDKTIKLNSPENSSPYILSISFDGIRGETLVHILEEKGVIVGTGSACSSKKGSLNRTLEAMGLTKRQNEGAIRISFSNETTLKEIKSVCGIILESYEELIRRLN
ncbi:MAG: cysteine desulfurase family protein [Clostridia bacterium]|nr:cysteine desulfurase family protein [Clostridia bacterium]